MSGDRAEAFKSQVPPKTREYIDAKHIGLESKTLTTLSSQTQFMERQKDEFDAKLSEMSARIKKMEDILNLQIGSRRYLLDLIDYLNEMEEKKRS